jgi:SNF2 family DNA or RNA helicase
VKTLLRCLQPHQVEAVQFLWNAVLKSSGNNSSNSNVNNNVSGAILADSMGLGKTLTSIAFVYLSIFHRLATKVVVVVPSSLVQNWASEFTKWLRLHLSSYAGGADRKVLVSSASFGGGAKAPAKKKKPKGKKKPTIEDGGDDSQDGEDLPVGARAMGGAEQAVVDFMATRAPVLVISYEGYRKHAALLNRQIGGDDESSSSSNAGQASSTVGMLVCDEGHRYERKKSSLPLTIVYLTMIYKLSLHL